MYNKRFIFWLCTFLFLVCENVFSTLSLPPQENNNPLSALPPPSNSMAIQPYVSPATTQQNAFYTTNNKRSPWCIKYAGRAASICKTVKNFQKYKKLGCIDDVSRESACIKSFCSYNCMSGMPGGRCPTNSEADLRTLCLETCRNVNLGDPYKQNGLAQCLGAENVLSNEQVVSNAGARYQQKQMLRAQSKQSASAFKSSSQYVAEITSLSQKRLSFLQRLGNGDMAGVLRNSNEIYQLTDRMYKFTQVITQQGIPLMTETDKAKINDALKRAWSISSNAMEEFYRGLSELAKMQPPLYTLMENIRTVVPV